MTPAEELRAAAKVLRETASKAAQEMPPPWHLEAGFNGEWLIGSATPHLVANARKPAAEWIALASPALAEPLAAWLESAADDLGGAETYLARTAPGEVFDPFEYVDEPDSVRAALPVARTILGSTP